MNGLFEKIEKDKDQFVALITEAVAIVPAEITAFFPVSNRISEARVALAYSFYMGEIQRYSEYLNSKNPDHYKRSGALLHALCTNPIVDGIEGEHSLDDLLDPIGTRYTTEERAHLVQFMEFHEAYCNELVAFGISHRVCASYEVEVKPLSFNLVHNICHYLKKHNGSLPPDAYFMLFRTLMA